MEPAEADLRTELLAYDDVIEQAANQYGIKKSYIQAVLFREIYCIGYEDEVVDLAVEATHAYHMKLDVYEDLPEWVKAVNGRPLPIPRPIYRIDSSTGLGQILASTAIAANNWAVRNGIIEGKYYDVDVLSEGKEMWDKLRYDDGFNIDMVGMVLMYEAGRLGYATHCDWTKDEAAKVIAKYNGNIDYGYLVYKYAEVFDRFNLAQ